MFNMTRDEVEKHYRQILAGGRDYEKARANADQAAQDAALAAINAAVDQLWPKADTAAGKKGRVPRPPIEIPPGTFLLTAPLIVWTHNWFMGAGQIIEDVEVDVKVPQGRPAFVLRAVRNNNSAMANGQVLRDVRANGPVVFINDANDYNDLFDPTRLKRGIGKGKDTDWDQNSAATRYRRPMAGYTPSCSTSAASARRSTDTHC